jgi:AcrR family transcriptional regulator
MVSKTRDKLIEVARQLFANKGVENTTMNDIAAASEKGRRTIYTYFKSKREIYNAVVERQSERMVENLRNIASSTLEPVQKLEQYLNQRFQLVVDYAPRHDMVLRHIFDRDLRRMERVHKLAAIKESEMFRKLLDEGIAKGAFDPVQAERLLKVHPILFQGVDFCVMRDSTDTSGISVLDSREAVVKFLVAGIATNNTTNN